jgi:surface protein
MTKTTKKRARRSTTLLFALFSLVLLGALTRVCDGAGYYAYDNRRHDDNDDKVHCYNGANRQNTDDPRDCFDTCDSCSSCKSFVYKISDKQCQFVNHNTYSKTVGKEDHGSDYEWYRPISNKVSNNDFATRVAGCLAEAPNDGMCKKYGGRGFSDYTGYEIGSMPDWDVSGVTDMEEAFFGKGTFNADLSSWDVSSVTNMESMFHWAKTFNKNIGNWNVAKVKNMKSMFDNAQAFKQNIGNWNVASVENMALMFYNAFNFNGNIGNWNVASVEDMQSMFYGASIFNADISGWVVASVKDMEKMFYNALAFDQDISDWSVSASATTTDMLTGSAFVTSRSNLAVTVSNDGATTSDEEFALGVSVSATACTDSSSCDLSKGGTSTDDVRAEGGLYCDVTVKKKNNELANLLESDDFGYRRVHELAQFLQSRQSVGVQIRAHDN